MSAWLWSLSPYLFCLGRKGFCRLFNTPADEHERPAAEYHLDTEQNANRPCTRKWKLAPEHHAEQQGNDAVE